jgi:peptidoglycan/LPS O-acetylase OafA/YrhL
VRSVSAQLVASLNLARGLSAVYVVASHSIKSDHSILFPWRYGGEVVMAFFLLSGFVIFLNEHERASDMRAYYLRRLKRIYPVLLVALLISTLLYASGLIQAELKIPDLLGTLASLQDQSSLHLGVISEPYLGNGPLWSLSFEVLFYLLFPHLLRITKSKHPIGMVVPTAIPIIGLTTYLAVPNHFSLVASYFAVWWLGAAFARAYLSGNMRWRSVSMEFSVLLILVAIEILACILGLNSREPHPMQRLLEFASGVVMGLLILSPLRAFMSNVAWHFRSLATFLAGISYSLYAFHFPVFIQTGMYQNQFWPGGIILLLVICWVVEVKFVPWLLAKITQKSRDIQ